MKIAYRKEHLNVNLIFGVVWLVWFLIGIFTKEESAWLDYGWLLISIFYFAIYFYQKNYKYLKIENGVIRVNGILGKKISLNEIRRIKKFAGDYTLKTDKKELTINTQLIEVSALDALNKELEKLNIEWK